MNEEVRKRVNFTNMNGGARFRWQERDLDILLYLNEMGPQRADVISLKFFYDGLSDFTKSKITIASRRLKILTNSGFLKMFYNQQRQAYWYCSKKGHLALLEYRPELIHLKAIGSIPLSLIDHMDRISWSRVALEYSDICKGFRSERRLKTFESVLQKQDSYHLNHKPYIPDGLFINSEGQKIIFEYEHSTKTTKQMEKRVKDLEDLLRLYPDNFEQVLVVSTFEGNSQKYQSLFKTNKMKTQNFNSILKQAGIDGVWQTYREKLLR